MSENPRQSILQITWQYVCIFFVTTRYSNQEGSGSRQNAFQVKPHENFGNFSASTRCLGVLLELQLLLPAVLTLLQSLSYYKRRPIFRNSNIRNVKNSEPAKGVVAVDYAWLEISEFRNVELSQTSFCPHTLKQHIGGVVDLGIVLGKRMNGTGSLGLECTLR